MNETRPRASGNERGKPLRYLGFGLLIAAAVLWVALLAVPFLPVATAWKLGIGSGMAIAAEVAFWVSAVILGREVVKRYRSYINPRNWKKSRQTTATGAGEPSRNGHESLAPSTRDDERGAEKPDA